MTQRERNGTDKATAVVTSSRLKVWWLSSVNGYGVKGVSEIPHAGPLGQIRYHRVWTLEPKKRKNK